MSEERVFITEDNMATFLCPQCGVSRTVDVSNYLDYEGAIKVKCTCKKCSNRYAVTLERRKYYRKETNLPGVFIIEPSLPGVAYYGKNSEKGLIVVLDISLTGVRVKFSVRREFKVGEKVSVEFNLDDKNRTLIRKEAVVRRIIGESVGLEFTSRNPDDKYDKSIGFYMFS
ncbi:MAG: PilZ domain-containing protein [Desulfobacterales bacterium]|nr:PilZ domain-containing protein [Desulfobacterales bacterium]